MARASSAIVRASSRSSPHVSASGTSGKDTEWPPFFSGVTTAEAAADLLSGEGLG